nr:unnamed protein product [Spirometra erinaceieuropaei]
MVECPTDHSVATSKMNLRLQPRSSSQGNPMSNRSERRTALLARELERHRVDIAALNETWFSKQGQMEEWPTPPTNLRSTPPHPDQHVLSPFDAIEGHLDVPSVATLAPAGLCPRSQARPAERAGDKGDPGCDRLTDHRLIIFKMSIRLQPRRRPQGRRPPVTVATADENASVENRWCQLRNTVQSTALTVLGRARRQHQGWFDVSAIAISNLLAEKNRLHITYVNRPTEDNKAALHHSRRLVQQRLREMQEA